RCWYWRRQKVREVTASGQTVEEAVQSALKQLSMSREEVEIEVIDQGKKGFLGLFGATRAIVKVREKSETPVQTEENVATPHKKQENSSYTDDNTEQESSVNKETTSETPTEENIATTIEEAENYIKTIANHMDVEIEIKTIMKEKGDYVELSGEKITNTIEEEEKKLKTIDNHMGVEIEIETIVEEKRVYFDLSGEKIAILIGKRGKTLNAIQYLTQLCINKEGRKFHSVIVDAEGYRNRREETLKELAEKMASKAIRIDGKVALEPMPAYERKIIHSSLQKSDEVDTYSDGVEPHRYIVIQPK